MRSLLHLGPRSLRRKRGLLQVALPGFLLIILASALVMQGCGGGTTATTSGGATTSAGATATTGVASTSTTDTLPGVGDVDLQQDLASPAQTVLDAINQSVVNVAVMGVSGTGANAQPFEGIGSGVVYTSDGYILTNNHVVSSNGVPVNSVQVTFNTGETVAATIVGRDTQHDLAAIKVAKTGLKPVVFAKSSSVKLGQWAIAIGSPLDFRNTVTLGIVSGIDRSIQTGDPTIPTISGLLQTDAAISPGNSGGGLFDASGKFIGMPELYLPPGSTGAVDIGFAIPADTVATVAKTLTGQ